MKSIEKGIVALSEKINESKEILAKKMAKTFTPIGDGDKAVFSIKSSLEGKDPSKKINVTVKASVLKNKDLDKLEENTSFDQYAYNRSRYVKTYLPRAISKTLKEFLGKGYSFKLETHGSAWDIADDDSAGIKFSAKISNTKTPKLSYSKKD